MTHEQNLIETWTSGHTTVSIMKTEEAMAAAAQDLVRRREIAAAADGKRIVFWLMAAPSATHWYRAFVADCAFSLPFGELVGSAEFFQFDDYPIARTDPRFPVTFRHLLETQLIGPLSTCAPPAERIHLLELTGGPEDADVMADYARQLSQRLADPDVFVIQIKGIGMDGHWGFHGRETPLNHPPAMISVPINDENRAQQMIDWPEYFPAAESVPRSAVTATVGLFMQADFIVDLVPQASKQFSVLAAYGTDAVVPDIPASALKDHPNSSSFVTWAAGQQLSHWKHNERLTSENIAALDAVWSGNHESTAWARGVLMRAGFIPE
jgi:6-phosphogluconolactonase/glucosamine-6-phosphate isomerase/deaminase